MEQIINYVKPELVVVSIALYFLGMWMKNSKRIKDNDIPIFLGIIGIIICGLYVIATCNLSGMQNIFYGTVYGYRTGNSCSRTEYIR